MSRDVVLVAVHASRSSRAALDRARSLAVRMGCEVRRVHVSADEVQEAGATPLEVPPEAPAESVRRLTGDPYTRILEEASRSDVALLVVGRGERSWWLRRGRSPLSARLAASAPVAVLVVGWESAIQQPSLTEPAPIRLRLV